MQPCDVARICTISIVSTKKKKKNLWKRVFFFFSFFSIGSISGCAQTSRESMTNAQSSQSPFVLLLCHHLLLMEMLNECTHNIHIRAHLYIKINVQLVIERPRDTHTTGQRKKKKKKKRTRERDGKKMIDFYVCALSLLLFFSGTRSRNSEPYHFRRLPSALSLLAIPTHPTPHLVLHHLHYITHTKSHSLQIDKSDKIPSSQCVCMTTTAISPYFACASMLQYYLLFWGFLKKNEGCV